jgi:hypothetical protein
MIRSIIKFYIISLNTILDDMIPGYIEREKQEKQEKREKSQLK